MLQCVTFYFDHLHNIGAMNANFNPGEKIQEYKDMIFYDQRERGGYGLNNARNKIWIKWIKFRFLDPTQPTTTTKDVTDEASAGSAIEINNVNSTNGMIKTTVIINFTDFNSIWSLNIF